MPPGVQSRWVSEGHGIVVGVRISVTTDRIPAHESTHHGVVVACAHLVQSDGGVELGSCKLESWVSSRRLENNDVPKWLVPILCIDDDACVVVGYQPHIASRDVVVVIFGIEGTFLLQQKPIANVYEGRFDRGSPDLAVKHLAARVHEV